MKKIFTLILLALLPGVSILADGTRGITGSTRYISLKDGQVVAIPEKYILSEEVTDGICTLTLEGDTTFSYSQSNVLSISDKYDYPHGKLLSFAYTHADNDQVYADVEATITEKDDTVLVNADIPVIGKRLRPSFTLSEGSTLWVDGEQQLSGQSSQRFTAPIVYTLAQPKHWIYQLREVVEEVPEQDKEEDNNTSSLEGWSLNQVDISQLTTTNAPSNYEGEGLESLWDNMPGTFYHSTWGYGSYLKLTWMNNGYWGDGITEWPYLEVELAESIENFCFSYTTSSQNDRFPQGWYISAYNATTGEWDKVGVLSDTEDNLPQMYLEQYFSPVYSLGEQYSRIRFELTKASYKNYMVLSEFALYSCTKAESETRNAEEQEKEYVAEFVPFGRPCKVSVKYLTDHATGQYKIPTVYVTIGGDTTRWDYSNWIGMTLPDGTNTKEEWIEGCTFQLDGAGVWPDIEKVEDCEVRGRGNSSWTWDYRSKNPFRIKLPKKNKQSPFNLTKDRQWVFIANKQSGSMTSNSIAQKIAAMVDAEALCHMIPVDVYINGHYRGSYCFTEKIGIADNSVAIDEATGCLLELDDYFDETFRFKDPTYDLPVNVKDPDFSEEDEERVVTFEAIQNSFNSLTATLKAGGNISGMIDMESWARFWLVNDLVRNVETHHPKSCYLFNENPAEGEKWKFGPAWDFDWAFGYEETKDYFIYGADGDLFSAVYYQNKPGYQFYDAIRNSSAGKRAYYKEWVNFMAEGRLQELLEYVDDYTEFAMPSILHNNDAEVNELNKHDYNQVAKRSKEWLTTRANYIFNSLETFDISPDIVTPEDYGQPTEIEDAVSSDVNRLVDVYTIGGILVRRQVPYVQRGQGLEPGMYVIDGKVTVVK
ncbi:MAG: CotH kinase family protein [Bacteroidaceae bacterium]|nr:CotH kinase family protein [Bacteroidaceae bacterium]